MQNARERNQEKRRMQLQVLQECKGQRALPGARRITDCTRAISPPEGARPSRDRRPLACRAPGEEGCAHFAGKKMLAGAPREETPGPTYWDRFPFPGPHRGPPPEDPPPLTCAPCPQPSAPWSGGRAGRTRSATPFPTFPGLRAHPPTSRTNRDRPQPPHPSPGGGAQSVCALHLPPPFPGRHRPPQGRAQAQNARRKTRRPMG